MRFVINDSQENTILNLVVKDTSKFETADFLKEFVNFISNFGKDTMSENSIPEDQHVPEVPAEATPVEAIPAEPVAETPAETPTETTTETPPTPAQ